MNKERKTVRNRRNCVYIPVVCLNPLCLKKKLSCAVVALRIDHEHADHYEGQNPWQ